MAAAAGVLLLAGCGRVGPLQLPPGPATPATGAQASATGKPVPGSSQDTAAATGFDSRGNPVAAPGAYKSFILDPLLK